MGPVACRQVSWLAALWTVHEGLVAPSALVRAGSSFLL